MSKLVDKAARLAAMANLAKHFLSQAYEGGNTSTEREARHEAVKEELARCGQFDANDVIWLFYLLEERAIGEINKFAVLAQTTEPDTMSKQGIPQGIVNNACKLKEHHGKQAKSASAATARASKKDAKDAESFKAWAKKNIQTDHSGNIQAQDVRGMKDFNYEWGQDDKTLKKWVKEVLPNFKFKRGRSKQK